MGEGKQKAKAVRKRWIIIFTTALCISVCQGCQKTPEDTIVRQKKSDNIKKYESNGDGAKGNQEGKKDGQGEESAEVEEKEAPKVLEAPGHYKNTASYEDGALVIDTDAEVIVPEGDRMNTYKVAAAEMDQELLNKITEAFFPGAEIYDGHNYFRWTKEQYQKDLTMLKKYKAEGNLDPFDNGVYDDTGEPVFDIDLAIADDEENMEHAPDTVEKVKVTPSFGLEWTDESGEKQIDEGRFEGVAETNHGAYSYMVQDSDSHTADVRVLIQKVTEDTINFRMSTNWTEGRDFIDSEHESAEEGKQPTLSEDTILGLLDVPYEEAEKTAKEEIEKLGWDWELTDWDYALLKSVHANPTKDNLRDIGYIFYFNRLLDGIPVTFTESYGGALKDMDSTLIPWSYERCEVIVGDDGIQKIEIYNPYKVEGIEMENVKLMDFDSIMKIYEQMMEISNANMLEYSNSYTVHIKRIQLGYTRIYDPTVDSTTGVMVPVWDFFGGSDSENQEYIDKNSGEHSKQSFLTVNAVDGTIIDRGLGY